MKATERTERLGVRASYIVGEQTGAVEFVARVPGRGKPDGTVERARRTVARRLHVPLASVRITGVMTY